MAGVQVTDDDTELEPLDEMQVQHEVFARFLASEVSLFRENLETFGKELRESLQALKQELAKQVRAEAERTGRSLEQRLMVALEDRVTDLRQTLTGTQQGTQEGDPGLKPAGSRVASPGPSSPRPGSSVMRSLSPPALANPPVPSSTAAETSQRRSPLTLLLDEHVSDITVVSDDDEREGETLSMSQMRTSQKTTFLPQAAGGPNLTQGSAATRTATSLEDLPPQLASALAQHMTDTPSHSREKLSPLQNAFFMHQMEVLNITGNREKLCVNEIALL